MNSFEYNTIGLIGVILCLLAFLLLQMGKLDAHRLPYSLLNLLGSAGILFSLYFKWNLSAAVVESAWAAISAYGIIAYYVRRRKTRG